MDTLVVNQRVNLVTAFLANLTNLQTKRAYRADLTEFFQAYGTQFSTPSDITLLHLIAYRDLLKSEGKSSATVSRKISCIKSFLKWCVSSGALQHNPSASLEVANVMTESPTLAFTDEEASRLLQAPDPNSFYGNVHRMVLSLLFRLALRRSELVNIRLSDFIEDRGTKVLRIHGKGNKIRTLPLSQELQELLANYLETYARHSGRSLEKHDYLIQGSRNKSYNPVDTSTIFKIVGRYAKRIGLNKRVSPHSCRATTISQLLEIGESPRNVADFAGHSDIKTTIDNYDKKRDGYTNSSAMKVNYGA